MLITKNDIQKYDRVSRLKLINSIPGIRSVHLIGTKSNTNTNLAIFSSVTHLGSNPPLLSLIGRPSDDIKRDTLENIKKTKYYTINSVEQNIIKNAHQTSCKYPKEVSEFKECQLTEYYIDKFYAPFVKESNIKIGIKFLNSIKIKQNNTELIIGEIQLIQLKYKDLEKNFTTNNGVIGLNSYYRFKKTKELEYCRLKN